MQWFVIIWNNVLSQGGSDQRLTFEIALQCQPSNWDYEQECPIYIGYKNVTGIGENFAYGIENQEGSHGTGQCCSGNSLQNLNGTVNAFYQDNGNIYLDRLFLQFNDSCPDSWVHLRTDVPFRGNNVATGGNAAPDTTEELYPIVVGTANELVGDGGYFLDQLGLIDLDVNPITIPVGIGLAAWDLYQYLAKLQFNSLQPVMQDNAPYACLIVQTNTTSTTDASLCAGLDWVLNDSYPQEQNHTLTVTATAEYHLYDSSEYYNCSTVQTINIYPYINNTSVSTAQPIQCGTYTWFYTDTVFGTNYYNISVPSLYALNVSATPDLNDGTDITVYLYNQTGALVNQTGLIAYNSVGSVYGANMDNKADNFTIGFCSPQGGAGTFYNFNVSTVSLGGCPYVYDWNGSAYVKDNNILPASEIGNGTYTRDYYLLQQSLVPIFTTGQTSFYSLQIGEFESEIDYVDQVNLIAVDHPQGTNVAVTPEGQILTYTNPASPISAIDNNGVSELSEIATMNGNVSDPSTYFQGNAGDWLLLDFGKVTAPYANLILRDDMLCTKVCLDVQVLNASGDWQTVETLHPRAYWSIEAANLTAYLPKTGDFKVRLYWTTSHRLDYVGLDTSPPSLITVTSAPPILAVNSTGGVVTEKLLYADGQCVKLVNGQQVTMTFMLPNNAQDTTRNFIFDVDGYYYTITA
jgi:hypothetical protein